MLYLPVADLKVLFILIMRYFETILNVKVTSAWVTVILFIFIWGGQLLGELVVMFLRQKCAGLLGTDINNFSSGSLF